MAFTSGTVSELFACNSRDYKWLTSFTSEADLLQTATALGGTSAATTGTNVSPVSPTNRPIIPANFFHPSYGAGKAISIKASGILGCTGTPTYTFRVRFGTSTTWSTSDTLILASAALTCQSGISNQYWSLEGDIHCNIPGIGSNTMTLCASGLVTSPGGLASPFSYVLSPDTGNLNVWTAATFDAAQTYYIGISVVCSASNASNSIICKQLRVHGWN